MSPQPKQNHSTGPRTKAGKAASSRNAVRHGLASGTLLIPGEDRSEWESLLTGLTEEWQPATVTQRLLVQNMAKHHWLVERALRLQGEALAVAEPGTVPDSFALLLRYQTANERAFARALKMLQDMRHAQAEFVSQNEAEDWNARQAQELAFLTRPFPKFDYTEQLAKLAAERAAKATTPLSDSPPSA